VRLCWALDLHFSRLDVPTKTLTTRALLLPCNVKLTYPAADISANVTALDLWSSYLGVSAPGCSIGALGPLGGWSSGMSTWANADVALTVTAAISARAMHVKNFGVVGMCTSSIANRIRKQENRKVCAAFRSIKLGSASQDVVACVHHRGFFRARKGDCVSAGLGDRWTQLVAAVAGRESLPAPRSATNS
jgi:hypothetical protein